MQSTEPITIPTSGRENEEKEAKTCHAIDARFRKTK